MPEKTEALQGFLFGKQIPGIKQAADSAKKAFR
jgi:hypothetical protein